MKVKDIIQQKQAQARATGRKFRIGRPRRILWPHALAAQYQRQLLAMVADPLVAAVRTHLIPNLKPVFEQARAERRDSYAGTITEMINLINSTTANLDGSALEFTLRKHAKDVSDFNRRQVGAALTQAIGTNIWLQEPYLVGELTNFVTENVKLVKKIRPEYLGKVEEIVLRGIRAGERWETTADDLEATFNIPRWRAALIGRDQTSKFNGDMNKLRQKEAGISGYYWRGVMDERERDTHVANEGQYFRWDDPPEETGHPGEDINCRCSAEPAFDKEVE